MFHANKYDTSKTHDGEVAWYTWLGLVRPHLSPLPCDGNSILLCLEWRASACHEERPEIPGPVVITMLFWFLSIMILPGLDVCNPSWFSFDTGKSGVIPGSQVLKIIRQRIYAFMKAQKMRRFPHKMKIISEIGDNLVADRRNKTWRYKYRKDFFPDNHRLDYCSGWLEWWWNNLDRDSIMMVPDISVRQDHEVQ